VPRPVAVPQSQWRRGLLATERLGRWLARWEERARELREERERQAASAPPRRGGS
jgi:hypothetical protein